MHYNLATKQQKINLVTMTTASKVYTMVYKMVIFDENNKSIQIKRFLSKSTRVPHAKFYICKKVIFFENFDYRATLRQPFLVPPLQKKTKHTVPVCYSSHIFQLLNSCKSSKQTRTVYQLHVIGRFFINSFFKF